MSTGACWGPLVDTWNPSMTTPTRTFSIIVAQKHVSSAIDGRPKARTNEPEARWTHTQRGRAPPRRCDRQHKSNKPTKTESINYNKLATHRDKQDIFHGNKTDRKERKAEQNKTKTHSKQPQQFAVRFSIGKTGSTHFYVIVGLAPCYPAYRVSHLL